MNTTPVQTNNRLEWMDILRGILIVSVVLGHATSMFNTYIYQFHMGAFFFVSGYMTNNEKRSLPHTMYHRFLTTYLPVLSATVFLVLLYQIMDALNLYSVFLGDSTYIGVWPTIKELLLNGNLYVWWLGAAWFILVLFGASILNRLVFSITGKQYNGFNIIISTLLLLIGYYLAKNTSARNYFDLILIAQFYFSLGIYLKHYHPLDASRQKTSVSWIGLVLTGSIMFLISSKLGLSVDYPDRKFNLAITDVFMALNGLAFCYFLSVLLSQIRPIKRILQILGKNTLAIALFHFMWFNLGFILLYLFGVVDFNYLANFTPTTEIGRVWWPLFVVIGCGASVLLWKFMMRSHILRILFGSDKETYDHIWDALSSKIHTPNTLMKKYGTKRISKLLSVVCCVVLAAYLLAGYNKVGFTIAIGLTKPAYVVEYGYFDDHWCEQNAAFDMQTKSTGIIHFDCWYDQPLTGSEEIVVLCNDTEVLRISPTSGQFSFDVAAAPNASVSIDIQTNFLYPTTGNDIRALSFVINNITVN